MHVSTKGSASKTISSAMAPINRPACGRACAYVGFSAPGTLCVGTIARAAGTAQTDRANPPSQGRARPRRARRWAPCAAAPVVRGRTRPRAPAPSASGSVPRAPTTAPRGSARDAAAAPGKRSARAVPRAARADSCPPPAPARPAPLRGTPRARGRTRAATGARAPPEHAPAPHACQPARRPRAPRSQTPAADSKPCSRPRRPCLSPPAPANYALNKVSFFPFFFWRFVVDSLFPIYQSISAGMQRSARSGGGAGRRGRVNPAACCVHACTH